MTDAALKKPRRIEILITDINMPGMDGYALRRLPSICAKNRTSYCCLAERAKATVSLLCESHFRKTTL